MVGWYARSSIDSMGARDAFPIPLYIGWMTSVWVDDISTLGGWHFYTGWMALLHWGDDIYTGGMTSVHWGDDTSTLGG